MSTGRDRFWVNVGAVLSGTALAQIIPILGSLALARLFAPAAFGLFAAWLGMAHLAAVVITGRYENALALQGDGEQRRTAVLATLTVVCGTGSLLTTVALAMWWAGGIEGVPSTLLLLFAPVAMAIAAAQVWQAWAAGDGRFGVLSGLRIAQAFAVTGAQIVAGLVWPQAEALVLAQLLGLLLGLLWAWRVLPLSGPFWPRRAGVVGFWRERRRFPLLSLPADGINTAAAQLPLLIVGNRFGAEAAGCLALTLRVLAVPVGLLGSAVLDVFRRESATAFRERGECRAIFDQTFRVLAVGSTLVAMLLAATAEPLFVAAFGERWRLAGTMALWLLPLFALRFVASPLSYLFYVAGKQHVDLIWQALLLAMTLSTLLVPADIRGALIAYSVGYSAMYCVYLLLSYRFSRGRV